jgi:hypothetical protein
MAILLRLAVVSAAALVLASCGQTPAPSGSGGVDQAIVVEGRDKGFALSMRVASGVFDAGEPIDIGAILTWEGAEPTATIWGSGSGPVSFGLQQVDGDIVIGGMMTADCGKHDYARGVPVAIPYSKSGGFTAEDPNAAFYRAFFADPVLRLPAGRWRVSANAGGYLVPCEMDAPAVEISIGADILVR